MNQGTTRETINEETEEIPDDFINVDSSQKNLPPESCNVEQAASCQGNQSESTVESNDSSTEIRDHNFGMEQNSLHQGDSPSAEIKRSLERSPIFDPGLMLTNPHMTDAAEQENASTVCQDEDAAEQENASTVCQDEENASTVCQDEDIPINQSDSNVSKHYLELVLANDSLYNSENKSTKEDDLRMPQISYINEQLPVKEDIIQDYSQPAKYQQKRTKGIQCLIEKSKNEVKTTSTMYGLENFKVIKSKTMRRVNNVLCVKPNSFIVTKAIFGFSSGLLMSALIYMAIYYSNRANSHSKTNEENFAESLPPLWTIPFCLILSIGWGLLLAFKMNWRCITLLMLPSLFTTRGRTILGAIFIQLIINGPVANIILNAQEVPKASSCQVDLFFNQTKMMQEKFYNQLKNMSENYKETAYEALETPLQLLREAMLYLKNLKASNYTPKFVIKTDFQAPPILIGGEKIDINKFLAQSNRPAVYVNYTDTEIMSAVSPAKLVEAARAKIAATLKLLLFITQIFRYIMPFTMIFLLLQAIFYYRGYHNKLSHDNIYITHMFKKLDKQRKKAKQSHLLPLRRKERKKYIDSTSIKLSRRECASFGLGILLSAVLGLIATVAFTLDLAFYYLLNLLREQSKDNSTIIMNGGFKVEASLPEENFDPTLRKGLMNEMPQLYNNSQEMMFKEIIETESCSIQLWEPKLYIEVVRNVIIGFWIAIFLLSLLGAYGLRLQHCFASYFYPDIERRRVEFLYDKIRIRRHTLRVMLFSKRKEGQPTPTLTQIFMVRMPLLARLLRRVGFIKMPLCDICGSEERELRHLGDDSLVCELCLKHTELTTS